VAGWKAAGRKLVNEHDTLSLLEAYGLPVPRFCKVRSIDEVDQAFAAMGGTIAVKVLSEALPHRSEAGGVVLGVKSAEEARKAFEQVRAAALKVVSSEQIEGILFEEMLAPGLEMIAGLRRDESLGMAVVFGFGGVLAEVIDDVAVRFPPFSQAQAKEMLGDLRGARLIGGYRNIEGTDPDQVAAFLAALATLAMDLPPEVIAIDLNPVILNRSGLRIADGLLELEG
jgi:succinyl-CoA synthetase beta subunit